MTEAPAFSVVRETTSPGLLEREFRLRVQGRDVPGVVWLPASAEGKRPLVLVGHGGTAHKRADFVLDIVGPLVRNHGFVVAAIDGPVHGDRRDDAASEDQVRDEFREAWERSDTISPMVADWQAVLDALCVLPQVNPAAVAWYGVSMGTAYGLPLVAAEGRIKAAVLGMWGTSRPRSERLLQDAARVQCAVLFVLKWHDDNFPRDGQVELFDAFSCADRRMVVYPGGHTDPDSVQREDFVSFLVRKLGEDGKHPAT